MNAYKVKVLYNEHANCDSLPLRFGIHFDADQEIVLSVKKDLGLDPRYSNRFHVEATFVDPTNATSTQHFGHFVLERRPRELHPTLITVWRNDRDTEYGLSTTMRRLREESFVSVAQLLEMHPLYKSGIICDSPGLVKYLSSSIAKAEIQRFEVVSSRAKDETAQAVKSMKAAIEEAARQTANAVRNESVALEAIAIIDQLEEKTAVQQTEIDELKAKIEADEARYRIESSKAKSEGSVATLSIADTLVKVYEGVIVNGSLCTVLEMGNKRRLQMKVSTFDRDGSVTMKAKDLEGKRVKTTCWDPIREPGKWSSKGYFRNVYLTA